MTTLFPEANKQQLTTSQICHADTLNILSQSTQLDKLKAYFSTKKMNIE